MNRRKYIYATQILNNDVYLPESKMYKDAFNALLKLSIISLQQIALVVSMKKQ